MAVAMVAMVMIMAVGRRSIRVLSSVSVERGIVVDSCGRISGKVRSDVSCVFVLFQHCIALHCIAFGMGKCILSIIGWSCAFSSAFYVCVNTPLSSSFHVFSFLVAG